MANNNTNELVSEDDDPTAELEILSFDEPADQLEADAHTCDVNEAKVIIDASIESIPELQSDLRERKETISRLQYDIEQLHAKWLGLESEISARESQTEQLNEQVSSLQISLERKDKLLRKRDSKIRELKKEIRQREEQHRGLIRDFESLQQSLREAHEEQRIRDSADLAIADLNRNELAQRLKRSEEYADSIRQQLQDMIASQGLVDSKLDKLRSSVLDAEDRVAELQDELESTNDDRESLQKRLDQLDEHHKEEIRILRFELGAAQNTMAESEQLNSQLTSDLIDTRNFKDELERLLGANEAESTEQIDTLQKEVDKLVREAEAYEEKLQTKSEAVTVLLAELAKKTEQIESIGNLEDVIHDIDDRITERIDPLSAPRAPAERLTRLLVGTVDGQLLRFPLFKDRLTVGRTEDNDIQLKAAYISRRHAIIQTDREATRIIDWGSTNGVYVNSEQVKEHCLEHGDMVAIGNARFRYEERKKRDA